MELLNEKRYFETKELMIKKNVILSDNEYKIYSNVFEIISIFTNGKLTTEEIFIVYDILSDAILNQRPDLVAFVSKEDRIKVQVRLLEELPETKGKLSLDEKIAMAFCIYTGECVRVFDEESNTMKNGIVSFDSFEHINNELEYEKANFPYLFPSTEQQPKGDFAFSVDNAVHATSIGSAENYIRKLKYKGQSISFYREGSCVDNENNIIDCYHLFYIKKKLFKNERIDLGIIYINPYCNDMSVNPPKGFDF